MLPGFTLTIWLPGATTLSGSTEAAGTSPATGVVPGAGSCFAGSLLVFESGLDRFASGLASGFDAGVSPATGVVPGAGWALWRVAMSVCRSRASRRRCTGRRRRRVGRRSGWGVDCARPTDVPAQARTTAATARVVSFTPCGLLFITLTSGFRRDRQFASLDSLDASICFFGSGWEEYFDTKPDLGLPSAIPPCLPGSRPRLRKQESRSPTQVFILRRSRTQVKDRPESAGTFSAKSRHPHPNHTHHVSTTSEAWSPMGAELQWRARTNGRSRASHVPGGCRHGAICGIAGGRSAVPSGLIPPGLIPPHHHPPVPTQPSQEPSLGSRFRRDKSRHAPGP